MSPDLTTLTSSIAPHFRPGFLERERTVFQFRFDNDDEPIFLTVNEQSFTFNAGETRDATLTLYLDSFETCEQLLGGGIDGMRAFMEGRYRADGNIVLSQLLLYLFKPASSAPNIYEVQD